MSSQKTASKPRCPELLLSNYFALRMFSPDHTSTLDSAFHRTVSERLIVFSRPVPAFPGHPEEDLGPDPA